MIFNYLDSATKQFEYYKSLGEKTFDQLEKPHFFWQPSPESNSISIIVSHLHGNMLSRWTDFLTTDGEKEWRQREAEFEAIIKSKNEILYKWEMGWACLFQALGSIDEANFYKHIYIRNQEHTIPTAINRQLCHYAYHIGQIVYIGRQIKGQTWASLSIPIGQSQTFNKEKMAKGKHGGHFSDELK